VETRLSFTWKNIRRPSVCADFGQTIDRIGGLLYNLKKHILKEIDFYGTGKTAGRGNHADGG
jgi:hypothetical protein